MGTPDLVALRNRIASLSGPDREVDGDLFFRLDPEFPSFAMHMSGMSDPAIFATGAYTHVTAPAYTASIDAAVALVERLLPGWGWQVGRNGAAFVYRYVDDLKEALDDDVTFRGKGATPALSLLLALLDAIATAATAGSGESGT